MRTYAINSRLSARHEITVFTSVYPHCRRELTRSGVKYRRLGFHLPPFGLSAHFTFLSVLGLNVAQTPHDLVVEEFNPPIGFCGLPWWTSKPVVSIVQWFFLDEWSRKYHLPFEAWMQRVANLDRYRHFIVQSQAMERTFRKIAPKATIRVIPPGVGEEAFLPDTGTDGDYVLFLGRLDVRHKGLDLLIDSWCHESLRGKVPLWIAGEGPDRERILQQIQQAGLSECVKLVGRVEKEQKAKMLQDCRFCVTPSRYETFGITAAEAMAAGKPVVAYDIDHLNEVVREAWGVLVEPYAVEAFGEEVAALWNDVERCRRLGAQARVGARRFVWDDLARLQEAFYNEIVAEEKV